MSFTDHPGPLRPHRSNPRYFADAAGRARLLVGAHTWANFQERGIEGATPDFDFPAYLDFLVSHGHNFLRLWVWEQAQWVQFSDEPIRFHPLPYRRVGPGAALDGAPKFDLDAFEPTYFERLRERVSAAAQRGIAVSVMLFQGFSVERKVRPGVTGGGDPWRGHPFHRDNNANGVDGDPERHGHGRAVHTLALPPITELQERYVRRVVESVGDLEPVTFEVCNEPHPESWDWQCHMLDTLRRCQPPGRGRPVGLGACFPHGTSNARLAQSDADWISPEHTASEPYKWSPPPVPAERPVLLDTDHLFGVGGDADWVWRAFFRGANPIVMDPYTDVRFGDTREDPGWQATRRALGAARRLSERVDLASLAPRPELASSDYCLSDGEACVLVYWPPPGHGLRRWRPGSWTLRVGLPGPPRAWRATWIDPETSESVASRGLAAGATTTRLRRPRARALILELTRPE
jgi:hypothetical protein